MSQPAIEIENLSVTAGRRTILTVERLVLASGEFIAVMGPNGAGKSTLLRSCLGLQSSVAGQVSVFAQPLDRMNGAALAELRRRMGYVPQLPLAAANFR